MSYITDACAFVDGFVQRYEFLRKEMACREKSPKTIKPYIHYLAKLSVTHGRLPEQITDEEYVDYYYNLDRTGSEVHSMKKMTICALSYYRKTFSVQLPSHAVLPVPHVKSLPVVLSVEEVKAMLACATDLMHKCVVGVLYGAGLRVGELCGLQPADVDYSRRMIHVRRGKGRKDRYVPLSVNLSKVLRAYLGAAVHRRYVFENKGRQYTPGGIRSIVKLVAARAGILKRVTCHTLRHTFATHQIEMGMSIVDVQANLGHTDLRTTAIYLHVADVPRKGNISPLDIIYPVR